MTTERIQKAIARAGVCSRREAERLISAGRVTVNHKPITLGHKILPEDKVQIDGEDIIIPQLEALETQVLIYHKPEGEICTTSDEQDRDTVFENLPPLESGRWISVGRLDINSSGLLLFTNDGELANRLMHPSSEVEREYAVRVFGELTEDNINNMLSGVTLEDGEARFDKILPGKKTGINQWLNVILKEGRKREVRRIIESQACKVSRLIRVRYGTVKLPRDCYPGQHRLLSKQQVDKLVSSLA